jgi:hypothetical protein
MVKNTATEKNMAPADKVTVESKVMNNTEKELGAENVLLVENKDQTLIANNKGSIPMADSMMINNAEKKKALEDKVTVENKSIHNKEQTIKPHLQDIFIHIRMGMVRKRTSDEKIDIIYYSICLKVRIISDYI